MKFCSNCENMYYFKLDKEDSNKLLFHCRNCGHETSELTKEDTCVLSTKVNTIQEKFIHSINEYTKEDPTLPRTTTIKCPNQKCIGKHERPAASGAGVDRDPGLDVPSTEVIYIRYDETNMKYVYMCTACDTTWKTSDQV